MIKYIRTTDINDSLLTLEECKKFMRVDYDFEDEEICDIIDDCVDWMEKHIRIPMFYGCYNMRIDLQCADEADYAKIDPYYDFRNINVKCIEGISIFDIMGNETELEEGVDYKYICDSNRLFFPTMKNIARRNIDHMIVYAELGWKRETLPGDLHRGLKSLVSYYFENRALDNAIPAEVINSIGHYKRWY
jgi:hypothetical protein